MGNTISEIMIKNPVTLRPGQSLFSARELMQVHDFECLFVVDGSRPVGIVTLVSIHSDDVRRTVDDVMRADFPTVGPTATVKEAATVLAREGMHSLAMAVVDGQGSLSGVVRVRDIVGGLATQATAPEAALTPEAGVLYLAMSRTDEKEKVWLERIRAAGMKPAVTQVGANAEKLPLKLRESAIVAAIAFRVIREDAREKLAVSDAVREIVRQQRVVFPGLGGGFKVGIVRGEGRVAVAAFGKSGHALANSPEQVFLGTSVI